MVSKSGYILESGSKLTNEEEQYCKQIKQIMIDLLNELKTKNYLKTANEIPENSTNMFLTHRSLQKAYNMFLNIFYERGKSKKFIEQTKEFGLTEEDFPYLWLSELISVYVRSQEAIKNYIKIVIKFREPFTINAGIGSLLNSLEHVSLELGKKLSDELNSPLRNSLVHGTYWQEGENVFYCTDINLINPRKTNLTLIINDIRKFGIIEVCIFETLLEKLKEGFFD